MKIKIMVLMFLSLSLFGKDWWTDKNEENNTAFLGDVSNLKIIKTKARTYSQIESELIQKAETGVNKKINTKKAKLPYRTYDLVSIKNDYEILRKMPEMGYFRWETEWEDTMFQIKNAKTYSSMQLVNKAIDYVMGKELIKLSAIETLELFNIGLDRVSAGNADTGEATMDETTVQTTVVLGRKINGIPVYGNGSKVVVRFDNMGEITMLTIDWKEIDYFTEVTNEKTQLKDIDSVFETTIKKPGQKYTERRCGYFDGGIKMQSFDLVPVCFYFYENETGRYGASIPIFKNHDHLYYNK